MPYGNGDDPTNGWMNSDRFILIEKIERCGNNRSYRHPNHDQIV